MISKFKNNDIIEFIQDNINSDPSEIVLKGSKNLELPIREIALQIESRQKGMKKIPEWVNNKRLVFPEKKYLEQASSQKTAEFKATLYHGNSLVDLTGGTGIDAYYMSKNFKKTLYVESERYLCELAKYNFGELETTIEVYQSKAEEFIENNSEHFDMIYLDPSRRNKSKQRVIQIEDYSPNVINMLPRLIPQGEIIVIKASPMVDIKRTIKQLKYVSKVICLAVGNEMKEVLFEMRKVITEETTIEAVNLMHDTNHYISGTYLLERKCNPSIKQPQTYLYDANSAIRKAGFFNLIGSNFNLGKLENHTHLYTSNESIKGFPGRIFKVIEVNKPNKKIIKKIASNGKINVITKNYPLNANEIKNKYKLKDGGNEFLIFCRIHSLGHRVIYCVLQ
jgi:16S rRNA G966 N2-methylase RsmD